MPSVAKSFPQKWNKAAFREATHIVTVRKDLLALKKRIEQLQNQKAGR